MKSEKDSLFEAPLLLWLFSPALGMLAAAPLLAGQLAARLLTARMRSRPRALADTAHRRPANARDQLNAWASGVNAGAG